MSNVIYGPNPCQSCGGEYGEHSTGCSIENAIMADSGGNVPLRFRIPIPEGELHPNGSSRLFRYGVYFPVTDLVVGDMGGRGTGMPSGVEWLDTPPN